ncbi:type II secretion system F family protein [Xanthomonas euvesicatoria]|uniref:type II secretion system F family protein n=1 Tax=Xanthomonas euvesicatoria TaxID=456327 RepID=UPI001C44D43C|nr:type II secretion system F family protein [Xanthomonas euvesicatoria]MBV6855882.1 type II secretion system F family protein [Xanthomonas campestris pv. mirabilis]MBV6867863.1 type II secretion system F family protein [Xanthomonas campestris pv. coriandri]MCE4330783.1 type II secretion system F family protein [Xanthomonas campestris pv. coriandri]
MELFSPATQLKLARARLGAPDRARFYRELALLLGNNVLLADALERIHGVATMFGKKPNAPKALMVKDMMNQVAEGRSLAQALGQWAPAMETSLIAAGEASGDIRSAFRDVLDLHESRSLLTKTFLVKVPYPILMYLAAGAMLVSMAKNQVPPMLSIAPIEEWTGASRLMIHAATAVDASWPYLLALAAVVAGFVIWSLPMLTGNIRYYLDKFGPWKAYRNFAGAMFLKSYATMVRNQIKQQDALLLLSSKATPYLRERIDGALMGISMGKNFGASLRRSDYDFPDPEAIAYIELLSDLEGFDAALANFATDWLETAVSKISAVLNLFFYSSILFIAALGAVTVISSQQMTSVAQTLNR